MSEDTNKLFENAERTLSPEKIAELDREGKTVIHFMETHSKKEIDSYIKSLSRDEHIAFVASGLWECYRVLKNLKKVAA